MGVALLGAGVVVALLPIIGIVGSLLSLVGAVLVIIGRKAFGDRHARNVVIAIVLFVAGFVGGFLLGLASLAELLAGGLSTAAITNSFNILLGGAVVLGVVSGLASVLFLWELLSPAGRILIVASYALGIVISVGIWIVVTGQIGPALTAATGSPPDLMPLLNLDLELVNLRYLNFLPALLAAGAAYTAWSRIEAGLIPKRKTDAGPSSID